jgi:thiol-disulfide isomerase/thioredoxin
MRAHSMSRILGVALLALVAASCAGVGKPVAPPPTPVTAAELKQHATESKAKVVLINVWASWCEPCRDELPALVRLRKENAGTSVEIVLVSADFDKTTQELVAFLSSNGIDFPTYLKTERDAAFIAALDPDWSGAIPASFLYVNGKPEDFWEGAATYESLARKIKEALDLAAQGPQAGG